MPEPVSPPLLAPALKPGDMIGVTAPAGPFPRERFDAGLDRLKAMGFEVAVPPGVFQKNGFLAGSDEERAAGLASIFADRNVKAVMAARGGYGSMRLLDRIDFETISRSPKTLIGFSDITTLLLAFQKTTGLVGIHGPVVTSLSEADDLTLSHFKRIITGETVFPIQPEGAWAVNPGRAEGRLLGGNLTLLVHLLATPYVPDLDGAILFLEDISEASYRLDRLLITLKLAGLWDRLAGVILGDFNRCGPPEEIRDIIQEVFSDFPGPVAAGFPFGHMKRNLALPVGVQAVLDSEAGTLDVLEPYLL
jgi:muramoyltetrapeptide carboxypeptidase